MKMEDQPIDGTIKKIKPLYRMLGMNIENRPRKWSEIFIYNVNFLWLMTDIIGGFSWILQGISNGRNFIELTHVAPCLTLGINAEFKTATLLYHYDKVLRVMSNIREMERLRLANNPVGEAIVKQEMSLLHPLITVMTIVYFTLAVLFDFGPLVLIAVKYFTTNELELTLPFLDVYPVDCYDLRIWPFAYFHQVWTAWIVLAQFLAVDFFFYLCCDHIGIQFKLLQQEIENLISDKSSVNEKQIEKKKFVDFVKWHQEIISTADILEDIYANSILLNYLTSSIIICLTGFNVTAMDDMAMLVTFAIVFCMGMMQIYFLCFFGDMLMASSTSVSKAVYNCKWYLSDAALGKSALIMQTRSQKPCKVTAAKFADVNLNAFMKIISTSWSYFALLQTLYQEN